MVLLDTAGIVLTDQGLVGILAIFAVALFGSYGYASWVHRGHNTVITSILVDIATLKGMHELTVYRLDHYFDVGEANAVGGVLGHNPLNEEQLRIAEELRAAGTSAALDDSKILNLIQGLDHEKQYLEERIKADVNPIRVEHLQMLQDVKELLKSLNARLAERRFARELEEAAIRAIPTKHKGFW